MLITIGLYSYLLMKSCTSLGNVQYPLDDGKEIRIIELCTDYGPEQTKQEFVHEVIHACLHNHAHSFGSKEELAAHLAYIDKQPEEAMVANLAACMVPVLGDNDVTNFLRLKQSSDNGSSSWTVLQGTSQTSLKDQLRHSSKRSGTGTVKALEDTNKQ